MNTFGIHVHVQKSASSTLGLHWKEVDKPEQGTEISNEKLCEALQSNRLNFTRQELNTCGVKASDAHMHAHKHFVLTTWTLEEHSSITVSGREGGRYEGREGVY